MWWIDKFGSVSGPYSDEQIRRGVRLHQFTRLHKISSDRRNWSRLGETAFWSPIQTAPTPIDLPENLCVDDGRPSVSHESISTSVLEPVVETRKIESRPMHNGRWNRKHLWCVVGSMFGIGVLVLLSFVFTAVWNRSRGTESHQSPIITASKSPSKTVSPDDFAAIKKCVVLVHVEGGNGTAFLVKMDGKKYVLTNHHVIRSKSAPKMTFVDGTELALGNLSVARDRDLARFEVSHDGDYLELAEETPNNNDAIWIYGNSLGDGVITTLRGFVTGVGNKVLKVNAEFVCGNSGSPILGKDGKVLGVAAYLQNGANGKDWTTKGTSFDSVRRFGIRLTNVEWVPVDRRQYEHDCARLEQVRTYWQYLLPYCIGDEVSDEERAELKLEHQDLDRKSFGADEGGFHEMLMAVSAAYAGQSRGYRRWVSLRERCKSVIKEINEGKLTREDGEKVLNELDQKDKATWEDVKSRFRAFSAKRKEALLLARSFLTEVEWQNPLMRHGYSEEDRAFSVDWYLEKIQELIDRNAQKLKNLNKSLKRLESGDDEE